MTNTHSTNRFIQYSATCTLTLASSFAASAAQPFASSIAPTSNSIAQTIFKSSMAVTASQQSAGAFQARVFTGTNSNNAQTLQVTDTDGSGTIDGGDLGLMLLNMGASADDIAFDTSIDTGNEPSSLVGSVAGAQGLYAKNYIVTEGGVDYSVMDVYLKFNSAVGIGANGERVVNFYGQATTDNSTFGVTKISKYENSAAIAFQHSNTSWLPAAGAAGGAGNKTWDSFLTVGAREQGAGNTGSVTPDVYFMNPNSNVGVITGGTSGTGFVGAGVYQAAPTEAAFQTNASAHPDHMIMFGRFTLKCSDIAATGAPVKMAVWCNFVGKSTAQTGGTTMYTLASANLKSDTQTKYTASGKVWTFDAGFEGVNAEQAAWTFASSTVPDTTPTIISVVPDNGSTSGGTAITITGTNFTGASAVTIGGFAVTSLTVVSATTITAITPAGTSAQTIVVTTPSGSTTETIAFNYNSTTVPSIESVDPAAGALAGGTGITITGTNFIEGATVTIGGKAATNVVVANTTTITARTPAGDSVGVKTIVVTTSGGSTSETIPFTYTSTSPPTIASVDPTFGPTTGGTTLNIIGTNFSGASSVTIGGFLATNIVVNQSGTLLTAVTAAGTAGAKNVVVTAPTGTATKAGGFTYGTPLPTIDSISPNTGVLAGATAVTIKGTNLTGALSVKIGGVGATSIEVVDSTTITAKTPAGTVGPKDVTVTTAGGTATSVGAFTYSSVILPTIDRISPNSGTTLGGTAIELMGTNFIVGATLKVGGVAATSVVVFSATKITAVTPIGTAGAQDVLLTTTGGTATKTGGFTYLALPTITSLAPSSGTIAGSTPISIFGTNLTGVTGVTIGGAAATSVVEVSATKITAVTPAGINGPADVSLTTTSGNTIKTGGFTYTTAPPTIASVSPTSGPQSGGTTITITGTNFLGASSVKVNSVAAASFTVVSATSITAVTPAGSSVGAKSISVTTAGGTATKTLAFTYVGAPNLTSVSPSTGSTTGGTAITLTGTNLTGASGVTVGGVAATQVVVVSATSITAVTPAGTGAKPIFVTTPGGTTTQEVNFNYVTSAPTISAVTPSFGLTTGGTAITITGTDFVALNSAVTIGGISASNIVVKSATSITANAPSGTAGPQPIVVTTPSGASTQTLNFTYIAPAPTIATVNPSTGPTTGGTAFTITGTNLSGASSVTVGGAAATNLVVQNATTITAVTPAGTAGAQSVAVTTIGGTVSKPSAFTYVTPAPVITSVAPSNGTIAGGSAISIFGKNFTGASSVTIDGKAVTNMVVETADKITGLTPASATVGAKLVVVTTPGGSTKEAVTFLYTVSLPTITSVAPSSGPQTGGTAITILGTNLTGATSVKINSIEVTSFTVVSVTSITAVTPASTSIGAKAITVTTPGGSNSKTNAFTYIGTPNIASVTPSTGPSGGGTTITIAGTILTGATSVTVGGNAATNVVVNVAGTSITAKTPAGTIGSKDVSVITPGGTATKSGAFTYVSPGPTLTSIAPTSGSMNGATTITLTGSNFAVGDTTVTIGGVPATSVVVTNPTSMTAKTPSSVTAGAKPVVVTTSNGSSTQTITFTYVAPAPTITSIAPTSGPTTGGTAFTITGTNLSGASSVTVGGAAATSVVVVSSTSITAVTPAGTAGAQSVTATTPGGNATKAGAFTYVVPLPTLTSIFPITGPTAGGTPVTITGTNLLGASSVTIGSVAATSVVVVNATTITAVTPAGTSGAARAIIVKTAGGSATLPLAFSYANTPPTITSVSPATGSSLGGTTIAIIGKNFTGATSVKVGGVAATNVVVQSDLSITAVTPAGSGLQSVSVTTPGGTATKANAFTYVLQVPTITSVSPSSGALVGGTAVTITGTNFIAGATVKIGGVAATNVVIVNATSMTARTPAGAAGSKPIVVTTTGGSTTQSVVFNYIAPPSITSVSPSSGTIAGGTNITIVGINLLSTSSVTIGGVLATNVLVNNLGTSITATTPAGTVGAKPIVVTTLGGASTQSVTFTYMAFAPTITSISPTTGPSVGGTAITITGTNFLGATSVKVGTGVATSVVVVKDTQITAVTPAGTSGPQSVSVTTPSGTGSKPSAFTYVAALPTLVSVTPASGPLAGGTSITITGTNFIAGSTVKIGAGSATTVVLVNASTITAKTPAGTAGAQRIVVTTAGGSTTQNLSFTYAPAPTITGVTPSSGPTAGGTQITIGGTSFTGATSVTINGVAATSVSVFSTTSIKATTPIGAAGPQKIVVTTPSGITTQNVTFTYLAPPTITNVSPATGPVAGGTKITITGTNFTGTTSVTVGAIAAKNVVVVSSSSITATTPANSVGPKSVGVTALGGLVTRQNGFTYTAGFTGDADSPSGADATAGGGVHGGVVATQSSNGSINTNQNGNASTQADIESAAPMGVALYLQTVALRADAATDCNINSDALGGAEFGGVSNGAADSANVDIATAANMNAGNNAGNATTSTEAASQTDSINDVALAQFIDLDHNGVADICQLRSGDLDLDGAITQSDLLLLLNMVGLEPVLGIGDMDGNGVVDSVDMGLMLNQMQ